MKRIFMLTVAAVLLIFIAAPQVAQAVPDQEPPVPECIAIFAGYYLLFADDNISTTNEIALFVQDSVSGTVYSKFPNPVVIKYIRSGRTPTETAHQGRIFIYGNGVPRLIAVDDSGSQGDVACQR